MAAAFCLALFAQGAFPAPSCETNYVGDGEEDGYGDDRIWISEDSVIIGEKDGANLMLVDTSEVLDALSRLENPNIVAQIEREIVYKTAYWLDGDDVELLETKIVAIVSYDEYGRPRFHEAVKIGALTVVGDDGCYTKKSATWSPETIVEARHLLMEQD